MGGGVAGWLISNIKNHCDCFILEFEYQYQFYCGFYLRKELTAPTTAATG